MSETNEIGGPRRWLELEENGQAILRIVELSEIRTLRAEVELIDAVAADDLDPDAVVTSLQMQTTRDPKDSLVYRVRHEDVHTDSQGNDAVRVLLEFGLVFIYPEDADDPTPEAVEGFGVTTVLRLLNPFYREAVAAMLARVGIGPVTVGLMKIPPSSGDAES